MRYFHDFECSKISDCECNYFIVYVEDESSSKYNPKFSMFLMDNLGRIFDNAKINNVNFNVDCKKELFSVKVKGESVILNQNLEVFARDYNDFRFTDETFGVIVIGNKPYFISRAGDIMVEIENKDLQRFYYGKSAIKKENGKYSFIDDKMVVSEKEFDYAYWSNFCVDYGLVKLDDSYYVVDRNYEIVSKPFPAIVFPLAKDCVAWPFKNGLFEGIFDFQGNQLYPGYARVFLTSEDVFKVQTHDKKILYFDMKTGKQIGGEYELSSEDFLGGVAPVIVGENDEGFIWTGLKKDGSTFKNEYGYVYILRENFIAVCVDDPVKKVSKFYFVDNNENLLMEKPVYEVVFGREDVLAVKVNKSKYSYLDVNKLVILKEKFDRASRFSCGYGVVKNGATFDAVTKTGVHLSEISKFTQTLDEDPLNFLKMPLNFREDRELLDRYYRSAKKILRQMFNGASKEEQERLKSAKITIDDAYQSMISRLEQKQANRKSTQNQWGDDE